MLDMYRFVYVHAACERQINRTLTTNLRQQRHFESDKSLLISRHGVPQRDFDQAKRHSLDFTKLPHFDVVEPR